MLVHKSGTTGKKVTSLQKTINEHRPTGTQSKCKWLQPYTNLLEKAKNWPDVVNNVPMSVRHVIQLLQHTAKHSCATGKKNNANANCAMTVLMRA